MACEYICDRCGKRKPAIHDGRDWLKPSNWYQRIDKDGLQDVCSRECVDIIVKNAGKTGVIFKGSPSHRSIRP